MKSRRRRLKRNRLALAKELAPTRALDLVAIPPEDVPSVWELGKDYIEEGCQFGEVPPSLIYEKTQTGEMQLWFAWSDRCEGVGVTQLINCPEGLVCLLVCMSCTDFLRCRTELAPQWEAWAKSMGCIAIRLWGRPGWERVMRDYVKRWVAMDKRL